MQKVSQTGDNSIFASREFPKNFLTGVMGPIRRFTPCKRYAAYSS